MASVKISTPDISQNVQTLLNDDYTSGTSLTVLSSTSFVSGNYIVVGEPGLENSEIISLTATPPDNTTLTISSLKFSHPKGTPVYYVDWDKYELSYRTSSVGSWVIYGSMPATLVFDAKFTEYRDSAATSSYQWRYRYYSTEKTAYSDYSDTISATGWASNTVGYMIREIRKIVNDPDSKTVSDSEIIRFLNSGQQEIYSLYDRWWFLLKTGDVIDTVASTKSYNMPTDFGRMDVVQFRFVDSTTTDITYNLRYVPMIEYDYITRDNLVTDDDNIKYYSIFPGDSTNTSGYLKIASSNGAAPETAGLDIIPRYYKTITDLDSYGDATEIPIPDILENYAIANILQIRKEDDKAAKFDAMWQQQIKLLKMMQRKSARPMRSLWVYKGTDPEKKYFGTRDVYSDQQRENNW